MISTTDCLGSAPVVTKADAQADIGSFSQSRRLDSQLSGACASHRCPVEQLGQLCMTCMLYLPSRLTYLKHLQAHCSTQLVQSLRACLAHSREFSSTNLGTVEATAEPAVPSTSYLASNDDDVSTGLFAIAASSAIAFQFLCWHLPLLPTAP